MRAIAEKGIRRNAKGGWIEYSVKSREDGGDEAINKWDLFAAQRIRGAFMEQKSLTVTTHKPYWIDMKMLQLNNMDLITAGTNLHATTMLQRSAVYLILGSKAGTDKVSDWYKNHDKYFQALRGYDWISQFLCVVGMATRMVFWTMHIPGIGTRGGGPLQKLHTKWTKHKELLDAQLAPPTDNEDDGDNSDDQRFTKGKLFEIMNDYTVDWCRDPSPKAFWALSSASISKLLFDGHRGLCHAMKPGCHDILKAAGDTKMIKWVNDEFMKSSPRLAILRNPDNLCPIPKHIMTSVKLGQNFKWPRRGTFLLKEGVHNGKFDSLYKKIWHPKVINFYRKFLSMKGRGISLYAGDGAYQLFSQASFNRAAMEKETAYLKAEMLKKHLEEQQNQQQENEDEENKQGDENDKDEHDEDDNDNENGQDNNNNDNNTEHQDKSADQSSQKDDSSDIDDDDVDLEVNNNTFIHIYI